MSSSVRTFIAINIIPEKKLLEVLANLREQLSEEAIKWVNPDNLHITLKFLGDTSLQQVEKINMQLIRFVEKDSSFQINLTGLGFFKSKGHPRVLFTNIVDFDPLKIISGKIESKITELGFAEERRSFKPHLTLARIKFLKDKRKFYQLVEHYKNTKFQDAQINEIIFYQSELHSTGPVYHPLQIIKLKG